MPWKRTDPVKERVNFVGAARLNRSSFSSLAALFGISPKTGYKWLGRFESDGLTGLVEKSRRPHSNSRAVSPAIAERILGLRRDHPTWGPRKLVAWLSQREPQLAWPAPSTVGDLLKAKGYIKKPLEDRRRFFDTDLVRSPLSHATTPNAVWSMDFKGWFRLGDRSRCDPYTVTDNYSRYLLCCEGLNDWGSEYVWAALARTLREFGIPAAVRFDNGQPWRAAKGQLHLTTFSVKLLKLGIALESITPGKPQENGRHERFHLTLQQDTTHPPAKDLPAQRARFKVFQKEFNNERPHEALGMRTPASAYSVSARQMPAKLPVPVYPTEFEVSRVDAGGWMRFQGERYFVSTALKREPVGLVEVEEGCFELRFCSELLGRLHRRHPELGLILAPRK
jgi:transposase InsO family protein